MDPFHVCIHTSGRPVTLKMEAMTQDKGGDRDLKGMYTK